MHLVATIAFWLATLLPPDEGSERVGIGLADLARARQVFRAADRDGNGTIQLGEAIRAKIPAADFAREDYDADLQLSPDEFVLYYRHLLVSAGRPLAHDLDTEAARIQALRRCKKPSPARTEAATGASAPLVPRSGIATSGPAGSRLNARTTVEPAKAGQAAQAPVAERPSVPTATPAKRAPDEIAPATREQSVPASGVEEREGRRQSVVENDAGRPEGGPRS